MPYDKVYVRLPNKPVDKVSTQNCEDVFDLLTAVKERFKSNLENVDTCDFNLRLPNGDILNRRLALRDLPLVNDADHPYTIVVSDNAGPAVSSGTGLQIRTEEDPIAIKLEELKTILSRAPALREPPLGPPISTFVKSDILPKYDPQYKLTTNAWCVATAMYLPKSTVKAAHIFQKKWHMYAPRIGLHDIHDERNIIPLFSGIEEVLDSGEVLIYYDSDKQEYIMRLLNKKLALYPLNAHGQANILGSLTYGDLDGRTLTFKTGLRPMRRVVQFLAQVSRSIAIDRTWIGEQDLLEVIDDRNNSPVVLESGYWKEALDEICSSWMNNEDFPGSA